jgi:DNA-binding CsgD family transcriptional regulator
MKRPDIPSLPDSSHSVDKIDTAEHIRPGGGRATNIISESEISRRRAAAKATDGGERPVAAFAGDEPTDQTQIARRLQVLPNSGTYQPLTPRQHTILWLLTQGYDLPEIARIFGVRRATVHQHLANAQRRLRGRTRLQAISLAFRHGYLF